MTRARDLSRLANSSNLSVSGTGLVGIGSTQPDSKLDVDGTLQVSGISTFSSPVNLNDALIGVAASFSGIVTATSFVGNNIVLDSGGVVISGVTTVSAGSTSTPSITPSGDSNTGIFFPSPDTIAFAEDGSEAARIDSSGRLLLGTSSARSNFFNAAVFSAALQLEGTGTQRRLSITGNEAEPYLILARETSGSVGGNTIVAAGDPTGAVSFQGSDGGQFVETAKIEAIIDGTPGANDMPGRLVFSTTADGAVSPTERMRIDSTGAITHSMGLGLVSSIYTGTVTDNGSAGTAVFTVTLTFPDAGNHLICEVFGFHPFYTGDNEYYRFIASKRDTNNTYVADEIEDLTTTGSLATSDTTVTLTGRRPRSNTSTALDSRIHVFLRSRIAPTSVVIANA